MSKEFLEIKNISKSFPGVKALDDVSFNIQRGTVHAIVGENGAGKSTLIKILAGIYKNDSGSIVLNDKTLKLKVPKDATKEGISVVHQELKLAETLTVTENTFLGNLIYKNSIFVDWKEMKKQSKALIKRLGMDINTDSIVETLTIARKQIVEICKAINLNCKILIMDEPSATLTGSELKILFGVIAKLKKEGATIIYISHRLEEIFDIADKVTVLRDGKCIGTVLVKDVTKRELISMMVGRVVDNEYPKEIIDIGGAVIEVNGLNRKGVLHDINLKVYKGEVLGIAGLVGSGRTELVRAILGIDKIDAGEIILKGTEIKHRNFKDAIKNGFGLIPEDRKLQGLIQEFSVKENVCLVSIDKIIKGGFVSNRLEEKLAREYIKKLKVSAPSTNVEVKYLSGGNQQKVVVAKWLMQESEIIILDEPTRGIDVGAKVEIYKLINNLVENGKTVVIVSSELPEVLGMSDRVLVMREGRIAGEFSREEATQEKILEVCV